MNSYLGESNLTKPGLSRPQARSGGIICSPPPPDNKTTPPKKPCTACSPFPSCNGSVPKNEQLPRRCCGACIRGNAAALGSKIGQKLRDGWSQRGRKKKTRDKNEGRLEKGWGGTHLRVAGMQCNIRKTYTQPPSNPVLMKN